MERSTGKTGLTKMHIAALQNKGQDQPGIPDRAEP